MEAQVRPRTLDEVRALGLVTDVTTAGACLGIERTSAHALVRSGKFPVPVIRVGARWKVPVRGLLAVLGDDDAGRVSA
ncbi:MULTISPECIES: hypothetical protein [Protofrankia]|uniref:Helix-turn-helix domain-containing protein n=1 Tax=Protofrankia coriariae TaxID=1562887 RepID=A0ABR5F5D3_9ACTN|nr:MULTISPECIES: hypothetical protein [Protofrankia]KLL11838.1 hypothetical protein FrCorBMG51_08400 [Protofrankia coriariae]ONH34280.1 hypothetical protein BL254_17335 [Protofrankia sp. BMG5.30]